MQTAGHLKGNITRTCWGRDATFVVRKATNCTALSSSFVSQANAGPGRCCANVSSAELHAWGLILRMGSHWALLVFGLGVAAACEC